MARNVKYNMNVLTSSEDEEEKDVEKLTKNRKDRYLTKLVAHKKKKISKKSPRLVHMYEDSDSESALFTPKKSYTPSLLSKKKPSTAEKINNKSNTKKTKLNDYEENTKIIYNIQVTPPKKAKICDNITFVSGETKKIESVKANLTKVFEKKTSEEKMPNNTSTLKQLTISSFYKSKKKTINLNPKITKQKVDSDFNKPQKNSDKKEKHTAENHNALFETVKKIVKWVFTNDYFRILFIKSEIDLLEKMFQLPDQRMIILCIRLFTRQHKWYNLMNLCEELHLTGEGFKLREFFSALAESFVDTDYSQEKIEILFDCLKLTDIKDICSKFKIKSKSKKQDMINKLLEYSLKQCTLTSIKSSDQVLRDQVTEKLGMCIKLKTNIRDLFYRIHLLYSLSNSNVDSPNDVYYLMYKIQNEVIKYPSKKIDFTQIFASRQEFLNFAEAYLLKTEYDEQSSRSTENKYLMCSEAYKRLKDLLSNKKCLDADEQKPLFLRRYTASWIYCKVLTSGSQHLAKSHSDNVCSWLSDMIEQRIYCPHKRGQWYLQLALVSSAHKKDFMKAAEVIIDGLSNEIVNEVSKYELSIRGSKIRKEKISQKLYDTLCCLLLEPIDVPTVLIKANVVPNNEPGRKLQYVRTTSEGKVYTSVEELVITHYTDNNVYTNGMHCEGKLFNFLFILFFWDILFDMHIKDTFITEIQTLPLDLYSGEFYVNRTKKIDATLKNIREDWTLDNICQYGSKIYSKHSLEIESLVGLYISEETFHVIVRCIGENILAAVLERFAQDYTQFRSGLPDLFIWNKKELKCCFVEVKSEKDKLSAKQTLWINYLLKIGANAEVCHVRNTTKKVIAEK